MTTANNNTAGKFSNTKSLAEVAKQGYYFNVAQNPKTGKYFLQLVDEEGERVSSESAGSISGPVLEELLALPDSVKESMLYISLDKGYQVSDITLEEEDEEGNIVENTFKMIHKSATLAPMLFGPKSKTVATTAKPVVKKAGALAKPF